MLQDFLLSDISLQDESSTSDLSELSLIRRSGKWILFINNPQGADSVRSTSAYPPIEVNLEQALLPANSSSTWRSEQIVGFVQGVELLDRGRVSLEALKIRSFEEHLQWCVAVKGNVEHLVSYADSMKAGLESPHS
ncbi:unnamed protein product [Clonostachys byssicola]|uniref:Uncharacterized protein n=1 Tax=Clonostachys byssicola TaxID=160290 RepID=A0A9N9Y558_9HYPO|nr:unnamed protein product [Clonostachys byssicola]